MKRRHHELGLLSITLLALAGCNGVVGGDNNNDDDGNGGDDSFVVFTDPEHPEFSTTDVYDANGDLVRFDAETHAVLFDGQSIGPGTWVIDDNIVVGRGYQIRFGTDNGVRHAYITGVGSTDLYAAHFHPDSFDFDPTTVPLPQD